MLLQAVTNNSQSDVLEGRVQFQLGEEVGTSVMNEHPDINTDFS